MIRGMRTVILALIGAGMTVVPVQPLNHDATAGPVTGCSVAGRTLTVLSGGFEQAVQGASLRNLPVAGQRQRTKRGQRNPRIDACWMRSGRMVVSTVGGSVWSVRNPVVAVPDQPEVIPPPPVVPESTPEPTPVADVAYPPEFGRWQSPVTVYAPVDAAWGVDAAIAAYNTALPVNRQITRVTEPCTTTTCIPMRVVPMDHDNQWWWGLAHHLDDGTVMKSCAIDLSAGTLPEHLYRVTAHELGHCLGLPHWEHGASAMGPNLYSITTVPTTTDLSWISTIYRKDQP